MHTLRWGVFILVLFCAAGLLAHSPTISTTIISQQKDGRWILQVKSSLTAYEYEVENKYGPSSYATPEEFQAQVLEHVKDNMSIEYNSISKSTFTNGVVKLGHETNVIFELDGVPTFIETIKIYNGSFINVSRSQSAIIIFKEGLPQKQFILNKDNNHQITLKLGPNTIEQISKESTRMAEFKKYGYLLYFCLLLVMGILFYKLFNRFYYS